jgi:CheY-like chemotaxis protein
MNARLEDEIARRAQELVQKVRSLTDTHLRPAQLALSQWAQNEAEGASAAMARGLLGSIGEVIDFLKPVSDLSQGAQRNVSLRVLLLDGSKKSQNVAKIALGGTGLDLSLASSASEFDELVARRKFDAVLCDAMFKETAAAFAKRRPNVPLVLLAGLDMAAYLQLLRDFPEGPFFVSRDDEDRVFTIKNISTTVAKIINNDLFGIEKYLAWGTRITEAPVRDSKERESLIENMLERFKSLGVRSTVLDRVRTAAEELLMNAIYDAPADSFGKGLYNHLPRTERVRLPAEQQGALRFGTDGLLLGISVSDPFGGLSRDTLIRYLESCYGGAAGTLNARKGGAGRGLQMMIESADLTIFNVMARRRTEVISLYRLDASPDRESRPTFHFFHSREPAGAP